MTLQKTLDQWTFQYTNATQSNDRSDGCTAPNVVIIPFPTAQYDSNPFYTQIGQFLGLAMTSMSFTLINK